MLILAKSILGLMMGFFLSVFAGLILLPILKKLNFRQSVCTMITERHLQKEGTPTIGGLIFIIPTIIAMLLLYIRGSLEITSSLIIILFVFISYSLLGLADDLKKIKRHHNDGLTVVQKLIVQIIIAIVFFYIYMKDGGSTHLIVTSLNLDVDLKWAYGFFILFLLVGSSNAVNITDGEDGLAGGLSAIAFLSFGIISWGSNWIQGYQEIAIFCFILVGSLLGFLVYNTHPAKVFMGDTGSNFIGFVLAVISILGVAKTYTAIIIIAPLLVLALPIFDTSFAIIRRIIKQKSIKAVFKADRGHLHHKLIDRGYSQKQAVFILYGISATFGLFAIILLESGLWKAISFALLVIAIVAIGYKDIFRVKKEKKND